EEAAAAAGANNAALHVSTTMSPADAAHRSGFGFDDTPTEFRKHIMRFAFLPAPQRGAPDGWSTEYGRPDLPFMLREMATSGLVDEDRIGAGGCGAGLAGAM